MNTNQYRTAIKRLGLSQLAAARLLGAAPRTGKRWALGESEIPDAVAILLRLLVQQKISIEDVEKVK